MATNNGKIVKNFIYNTAYQVLVLIAPLITTPYVSRVLGVTNIGIYQYSQSIATYFVLIGAVGTTLYGQREIAYLQDRPKERSIAFWEIEIFRIAAVLFVSIFYFFIFCLYGRYTSIYMILTLEVLATAIDISWFFMGMENFKLTVIRNTIIKLVGVIGVFIFVKNKNDLGVYTFCVTAPLFIGNISLWLSLKKYLVKTDLDIKKLIYGIKKKLKPILILFLPQIAMDVYLLLDKTMIGLISPDIDQVGYYSQAQKIVKLILTIVTSLGTVMLPAMSAAFAKGDTESIIKSIKSAFRFIYMLSFALMFGLCAVANRFVPLFFGDGYEPVVLLMIVISPILVIIATSNVIGKQFLLPTNQQKAFTISIIAGAGVNLIFNLVLIYYFNAVGASIATILAELSVTIVQCIYVNNQLPLKKCLLSGIRYLLYGIVMFVSVKGADRLMADKNSILQILLLICIGAVIYIGQLIVFKDPVIKMGKELLDRKK